MIHVTCNHMTWHCNIKHKHTYLILPLGHLGFFEQLPWLKIFLIPWSASFLMSSYHHPMNSISWSFWWNTCFFYRLVNPPMRIPSKNLEDLVYPHLENVSFLMYDEPCPGCLYPFLQCPMRFPRYISFKFDCHGFYPSWFPWWCHDLLFLMLPWCHDASYYHDNIYNTRFRSLRLDLFVRDTILLIWENCYSLFPCPFSSAYSIFQWYGLPKFFYGIES